MQSLIAGIKFRQHQLLKAKMIISAISSASWLHSMERFVTTRTRSAKIVVASATVNTTVRSNVTSLLTSFAVCVAALDTWRATVPLTKGSPSPVVTHREVAKAVFLLRRW
jgi:hypothetical protein